MKKTGAETRDEIRGVSRFHSRVYPENEKVMDTLIEHESAYAPWLDPVGHTLGGKVIEFLHSLAHMGSNRREIFFARLLGMRWKDIGDSVLGGKTAEAAANEFADIMRDHPSLAFAFPERKQNGENDHDD